MYKSSNKIEEGVDHVAEFADLMLLTFTGKETY